MAQLRVKGIKVPVTGGLRGLGGVIALVRSRSRRRPSAADLLRMDDAAFAEFIRSKRLRTASDIGSEPG